MHLLYPVKPWAPDKPNEQLRYSLRSAEVNFGEPIESVWVVGDKPDWLTGVNFIRGNRFISGHRNVFDNILMACQHPKIPEEVVVMNDDFFVLDPVGYPGLTARCNLSGHISIVKHNSSWWLDSLLDTEAYLSSQGVEKPLSYELHRPMPIHTKFMREVLETTIESEGVDGNNPPQWRTLYGNLLPDEYKPKTIPMVRDGKIYGQGTIPWGTPYISTSSNRSFMRIKSQLKFWFPETSKWEKP